MALTVVDGGLLSPTNGQFYSMKNRIINGAMVIDQRNAGASITPTTNQYTVDRWNYVCANVASKFALQQNAGSVTPPAGYINYLGATSQSAYSVSATDRFMFRQTIEGFNIADLNWGTASASAVTLSFWVRSSLTGTFGGSLQNNAENRNYPFSYTINSANTWEQKSITIAGDTTGTWLTNNSGGIQLNFAMGVGSTYSATAGSWTASTAYSATGATSVVGTSGATFYITGVQLEKGSTATSFDYRPYGTELQLCQRYFESTYDSGTAVGSNIASTGYGAFYWGGGSDQAGNQVVTCYFKVSKRATPTITLYNTGGSSGLLNYGRNGASGSATASTTQIGQYSFGTYASSGGAWVAMYLYGCWSASAEL